MNYVEPPPTVTLTQSYSWVIHDIFFTALATAPFFASFNKRKEKQMQIQAAHLPLLSVLDLGEQMSPDGDWNAGEVTFIHNLRIGFSVIIQNQSPDDTRKKLDAAWWAIMHRLWPDQWIMNMLDTQSYGHPSAIINPDNVRLEGVTRGTKQPINWGPGGLNNELPIGELQYDVTVLYRTTWPPYITDDLLHVHMETVPEATDGTVPPADEVQRVITEIDLESE
jgi:hypothetical protein